MNTEQEIENLKRKVEELEQFIDQLKQQQISVPLDPASVSVIAKALQDANYAL